MGETETAGPAAVPQKESAPSSPPLTERQERRLDNSPTRTDNVVRMEPDEMNRGSEKKKKEKETNNSLLIEVQDSESNMQEKIRAQHSTRMEKLELNQGPAKPDRVSSLKEVHDSKSNKEEKMGALYSTRMEIN